VTTLITNYRDTWRDQ